MAKRSGFFQRSAPPPNDTTSDDMAALLSPRRSVVQEITLTRLRPNPFQARKSFPNLDELADTIRQHSFTSRLRVRPDPTETGYFQLVYGERRLRAAQLAGLTSVPCEVADHSDDDMIEIGLAENIQRCDLSPLEEASMFAMLTTERGYSVRSLAVKIGKNKSYIEDRLRLLRVPADVQQMVVDRPDSVQVARLIAQIPDAPERAPLIAGIVHGELSQAAVRDQIRRATPAHLMERDLATIAALFEKWRSDARYADPVALAHAIAQLETWLDDLRAVYKP